MDINSVVYCPVGASTDFLVEEHLDVPMDFSSVSKVGSRMGTGTMIVMDDKTCPVAFIHNLTNFLPKNLVAGALLAAMDCHGLKKY